MELFVVLGPGEYYYSTPVRLGGDSSHRHDVFKLYIYIYQCATVLSQHVSILGECYWVQVVQQDSHRYP